MPNFSNPFEVVVDATKYAIGAVLMREGQSTVYDNIKINKSNLNYTISESEMLESMHATQT